MKGKQVRNVLIVLALVAVLLLVVAKPLQWAEASGAGDPGPGTVVGIKTVEFADGATAIEATTYYLGGSSTGYNAQYWHSADVFVTADISGTNTITVTPQWSADGTNWVDAKYKAEGWVLPLDYTATLTNTSGVTSTTTATSTYTFAGSTGTRVNEWVTYQIVISADGSDYVAVPMHGNYLRLKAELLSAVVVTPTIQVVLRNDGGR